METGLLQETALVMEIIRYVRLPCEDAETSGRLSMAGPTSTISSFASPTLAPCACLGVVYLVKKIKKANSVWPFVRKVLN